MATLADLEILILDCQATGANPETGHPLEIGWTKTRASGNGNSPSSEIESYLLKVPGDIEIPSRVQRITGISNEDLISAYHPSEIWKKLVDTADTIASANRMDTCPTIIHFSRFEEPHLRHLHEHITPESSFPFKIICTHEITKRLFPDLPRRGLRAIAGYFGHSVEELRRSAHHVTATAFIWGKLVTLLENTHDISTLDELLHWLAHTNVTSRSGRSYPLDRRIRLDLPDQPGVYRMLRTNGDVLYVGKANSLRRRVNSYFQKRSKHAEHTLEMLTQVGDVNVTVTGSALEAALLECDEIKRLTPPYNVALRDRDRKLWYCSSDLKEYSHNPDDLHSVGPLLSKESLEQFPTFGELVLDKDGLNDSLDISTISAVLCVPPEYAPETGCFLSGLNMFRQRHFDKLNRKQPAKTLIKLGAYLWFKRLEEKARATSGIDSSCTDNETEEEPTENLPDQGSWTQETVASSIESTIRRGAHMIRKARWFCKLSESSLAWEARNTQNHRKNLIVFEKGTVSHCVNVIAEKEIPLPPGYKRPFRERQRNFDVKTYDRMRVVTTELRRLVSEGRDIELRFNPSSVLKCKELTGVLKWV